MAAKIASMKEALSVRGGGGATNIILKDLNEYLWEAKNQFTL